MSSTPARTRSGGCWSPCHGTAAFDAPSENLALRWADVDWNHNRIRVPSSKTEHIQGGDHRFIPLFPELRPYLMDALQLAEPGGEHVITCYRDAKQNLRTRLLRIIDRAGERPWPKLFHNLRSSRQTELEEQYPTHVVCAWLGNSEIVARAHYLQVLDAHFDRASGVVEKLAQKCAQHGTENARTDPQCSDRSAGNQPDLRANTRPCELLLNPNMTPTGFEPVSRP